MTTKVEHAEEAQKPPLKRLLFNKPAWSRPQKVASPAEFFHRSSSSYLELAAEAERKRKAKLAKKQAEQAKSDRTYANEGCKRQCMSSDDDDEEDDAGSHSDHDAKSTYLKEEKQCQVPFDIEEQDAIRITPTMRTVSTPETLSRRYENGIEANKAEADPKPSTNIIELDDSSNETPAQDEIQRYKTIRNTGTLVSEEDDFPASDDEYAELARRARERARSQRLEDSMMTTNHKQFPLTEPEDHSQRALSEHQPTPPPQPDPEVHILITSPLENTKPLIIKRNLSQRLKDVRVAWCQHQQFTVDMTKTVFLTWRGKRLFDVTSCKSLGIAVDAEGNVSTKGQIRLFGQEEQKIHMEAITEELLDERKLAKNRQTEEQGSIGEEETTALQKPQEPQIRIILKAKGFNDFKLIVKSVCSANFEGYPEVALANTCFSLRPYPESLPLSVRPTRRRQSRRTSIFYSMENVWN